MASTVGPPSRISPHVLITVVTVLTTASFLPKLEYLPEGNRNLIFGLLVPPPGYNLRTTSMIAEKMENGLRKYWASETGPQSAPGEPPKMSRFWFVAHNTRTFIGASSVDPTRAAELTPIVQKIAFSEPGTFGFVRQSSLFGRGFSGSRSINLNISGPEIEDVYKVARRAAALFEQEMPRREGNQLRPRPGLELCGPEVRVTPDMTRLSDAGVTPRELGLTVDAVNDGLRVAEVTVDGRRIDLTLRGPERRISQTQTIDNLPVVTRTGAILPASSLARIEVTEGPVEIRHYERERTVTLQLRPSKKFPLETAIEIIREKILKPLRAEGLPPGVRFSLTGAAEKLTQAWEAMVFTLIMRLSRQGGAVPRVYGADLVGAGLGALLAAAASFWLDPGQLIALAAVLLSGTLIVTRRTLDIGGRSLALAASVPVLATVVGFGTTWNLEFETRDPWKGRPIRTAWSPYQRGT